ncbi:tRNA (adenosine(37)-N6)-threonylcarbamoyltransferase complex dimerization subunit type 1 TsaB [Leptospira levettii]|uniref:tRNA (adenosine(37)-N6)-threonylcarbamoyltransferase complex dimerization subunit type 1 TsaB n=1 Tax=Leptospira levettii TaxID=2023178 RepID=UPI000C2AC2E3|nr:tRNA (adenosine(37)-N6)-threonylcarbamoyltransferase complex dimerization subunit type 1 TsaB [Leptospira levettii]PJZ88804.1 tRNA (adenosine(37)-N6)-threonylcarbamoyltransferase complex dimerization subunit type 1 TsaB [Leptospira levettii]
MNLLYFDTTQDWIHVSVGSIDDFSKIKIDAQIIESSPKEASYRLVEMIQKVLILSEIKKPDIIFVPNGPGSFTGIRITVTTARDLAQLWEIPVMGFDTAHLYLIGIAGNNTQIEIKEPIQNPDQKSLICLDGKQGKYYTKYFDGNNHTETKDQSPEEINFWLESEEITPNKWYYTGILPSFYPKDAIKIEATNLNLSSILQYSFEQMKQSKLNDYTYLTLFPNYIRGTYVDQK